MLSNRFQRKSDEKAVNDGQVSATARINLCRRGIAASEEKFLVMKSNKFFPPALSPPYPSHNSWEGEGMRTHTSHSDAVPLRAEYKGKAIDPRKTDAGTPQRCREAVELV